MKFSLPMSLTFLIGLGPTCFSAGAADLPKLQFNEVKEVAPGVFFRYSAIGPEGSKIPFGGSNNIWIVFEDYVVVVDANFPKEAGDVIQAIKKTTDKPIRYVLDTHHHGDHSYGNAVFGQEGASIVAQTNCARLLRVNGPKEFGDACVNGAFNFMGHSDSASCIRVLEKCQQLDVKLVLPGHGPPAGKELLE